MYTYKCIYICDYPSYHHHRDFDDVSNYPTRPDCVFIEARVCDACGGAPASPMKCSELINDDKALGRY